MAENQKRKILVLGRSVGSCALVKEAQKMGLHVINTDFFPTSPTKEMADEKWFISMTDTEELVTKCKEENVGGIICSTSEQTTEIMRGLCKRMNLPLYCDSDRAWDIARNKSKFQSICERIGTPVPKRYYLSDDLKPEELAEVTYPVVVKPSDESSGRGLSYCSNEEELIKAYQYARSFSKKEIICQRQLIGPEWVANYVLADGHARLLYFGREYHQPGYDANLYSMIVTTPYLLKQYIEEVNEKVIAFFKEADFKDGIAWVELMHDRDGHFYIIEPSYRFSSENSYDLYEKVDGFPTLKFNIEIAMGVKHTVKDLPEGLNKAFKATVASYHLFGEKNDVIDSISGLDEISMIPDVVVDIPQRKGGKVGWHALLGLIRIYGSDVDEVIEKIKTVNELLSVKNKDGEELLIRYTDYDSIKKEFEIGLKDFEVE